MLTCTEMLYGPDQVRVLPDGRMDPVNAAAYLGLSHRTLSNMRSRGEGPRFIKRGRVFYFKQDLDEWLRHGYSRSTAEARLKTQKSRTESVHASISR